MVSVAHDAPDLRRENVDPLEAPARTGGSYPAGQLDDGIAQTVAG
jgi:hypothetical protein